MSFDRGGMDESRHRSDVTPLKLSKGGLFKHYANRPVSHSVGTHMSHHVEITGTHMSHQSAIVRDTRVPPSHIHRGTCGPPKLISQDSVNDGQDRETRFLSFCRPKMQTSIHRSSLLPQQRITATIVPPWWRACQIRSRLAILR